MMVSLHHCAQAEDYKARHLFSASAGDKAKRSFTPLLVGGFGPLCKKCRVVVPFQGGPSPHSITGGTTV